MANNIFGIDVSLYQGNIDFKAAAKEGVKFVVIKCSEGDFTDPEFIRNYKSAKEAGLSVGAYHYLRSATKDGAVKEARYMIDNCLKGRAFEYPAFVDIEDGALKNLSKSALSDIVRAFCDTLESAGYWAGFYTNLDWYTNRLDGEALAKRYSFWYAYWGTKCTLPYAQLWQFGGSTNYLRSNKVVGVVCDQDYCFVDFPKMIAEKGLNGMKKSSGKEPVNKPVNKPVNPPAQSVISPGDRVKLKSDAVVYGTSERFAGWVYDTVLYVREVAGDRAVVSTVITGPVTGAVSTKYLIKV